MQPLPFLNRTRELAALELALGGGMAVLYGRRRLGKSTLLREALRGRPHVAYVGDDRQDALQRQDLAAAISAVLPGFADVRYPDWDALLARWWRDAPAGVALVLDEFPSLVRTAPELPSLLQKRFDAAPRPLALCGSSQRMMHGFFLDASAPLYGRATALIRLEAMGPATLATALHASPEVAAEAWAVWGGVPRYWELARGRPHWDAIRDLVLDPIGVLHREPDRLLADEIDELTRASSLLAVVAQGAGRASEIGARLEAPATSLQRPLALLVDLGFLRREVPFGRTLRDTRRTLYRVADPFLAFWYRFVEPNRSALDGGAVDAVLARVRRDWPVYLGIWWEELARRAVGRVEIDGERWLPAARWWGPSIEGEPLEIDAVAESATDPERVLVLEVKRSVRSSLDSARGDLERRARRCPELAGRTIVARIAALSGEGDLGPRDLAWP